MMIEHGLASQAQNAGTSSAPSEAGEDAHAIDERGALEQLLRKYIRQDVAAPQLANDAVGLTRSGVTPLAGVALQAARAAAASRYRTVALAILAEAGVEKIEYFPRSGRAWADPKARAVKIEVPTTRRRLFSAAHEAGHVFHNHRGQKPSYVQEYEATRYAMAALRQHGVAVPRREVEAARRYVVTKLRMGLHRGLDPTTLDLSVLRWCGPAWSKSSEAYIALQLVAALGDTAAYDALHRLFE